MPLDRHDLYELCVQSPRDMVPFLAGLHGGAPLVLREDFAGTAAIARAWAALSTAHRAVAVDLDPLALERCGAAERVERRCSDVRALGVEPGSADVVFAGNFSIGELATRPDLACYLERARRSLSPGGILVCDTYGGETALRAGALERRHAGPGGEVLHHVWEQREADPLTGRVVDVLHFRVEVDGEITASFPDAFVYRWRLWSVPELRDALLEAGFVSSEVHLWTGHAPLHSHTFDAPLPGFAACVVGRTGR